MITIIDYDAGNLRSVEKAFVSLGEDVCVTGVPDEIARADKLVLPGVGAFGDAMDRLNASGISEAIFRAVDRGVPLLGICLGLQILFESSEESPGAAGLGLLNGKVVKIPECGGIKIPHVGWNSIGISAGSRLLGHLQNDSYVYFVHSYYLKAEDEGIVSARTHYGIADIHAAVEKDNIFACQFHPEKSGSVGLSILEKFAGL